MSTDLPSGDLRRQLANAVMESVSHGWGVFCATVAAAAPAQSNFGGEGTRATLDDVVVLLAPLPDSQFSIGPDHQVFLVPPRAAGDRIVLIHLENGNNLGWSAEIEEATRGIIARQTG
jgi:hypothetical protein